MGITAMDQYGEVDASYTGLECLTFSGPAVSPSDIEPIYPQTPPCSTGSAVTFLDGVASGANSPSLTLYDAQVVTLTATDNPSGVSGTTDLTIVPGPISTFDVANPGTRTVGQLFSDTITAIDGYGNTATSYVGTQVLDFSGPSDSPSGAMPSYPSSVFFTNGMGTAENITLVDAQTTALMASQSPITGTSTSFLVVAGEATYYTVVAPSTATSGVPFTVTITAYDADGNVAAGYDGTADLASSIGDVSPLSVVLSNGVDTFNATLDTVGNQTITASDSSNPGITGASGNIDVTSTQTTTYTVTYSANNATSGTVPVDGLSPYNPGSLVTVLGNSGDLAVAGDNFTDWNTQANGLGNSYAPTSTFTIDANTILYAIFSPITPPTTYTVTYSANNATSGTVPVDGLSPYNPGSLVTVLGNSGDLAVAGDNFTDWNTQANGLGNSYAPTSTFTINANTILYAIFTKSLMITTTSLANATAGEAHYAQTLQGTGGTTPYTWSISEGVLPKGLSLNPSTGLISGSVSLSATTETFTVTLTDAKGASTTKQFTITVCYSLLITTKTLAGATAGESDYSQTLQGIGGATPYTWSISAGELPKGLSLNAASGLISGPVSSSATTETFTITLTDANGASTTKQFTITVCNFLAITTKSLEGAIAGQTNYSQTLQGTGGSQPYTWSISAGILPKGLFLNPSSGLISGNVSTSAVSETFTVKLSDANGASTAKQFTITVSQKPVFTCGNSGHAHFGHFFDFQFTAWGGPQPWFTVSGKLPSWLHFDSSNGIISGTPGSGQPGSYSFTVTATNSWGSQSQTFSLNVGN
ncbi:MAG: putative Ig domain-containing protein [Acidimicrobiales bacterium]